MFYVYILQSQKDNSFYIGFTPDLRNRLIKHNKKQVTSTKDKIPYKIIYYEAYLNRRDATGREKFLKSGSGWRLFKRQLKNYLYESS
ncbi:MAG: GIY-YIG nuclease family protein [Candidatus Gottesmanbacteria bacterium]|nr:GIY-YIG nuclease family protein [Candidatus Gottesmanbacteria bacterium]